MIAPALGLKLVVVALQGIAGGIQARSRVPRPRLTVGKTDVCQYMLDKLI